MVILDRKYNQVIKINDQISITVLQFENGAVKIGVMAPKEVPVIRCKITDYRIPPSQRMPGERYQSQVTQPAGEVSEQLVAAKRKDSQRQQLKVVHVDAFGEGVL